MHTPSLFLVGPMGAGKSTVGRLLAERLGFDFHDSDHEIEARTGATIPMIFDIEGEAGFRRREAQVIDELTQKPNIVLATGGGAVLRADNRKHLRSRGFVIYLHSDVDNLFERVRHDRKRPLLQNDDPKGTLAEILRQREPLYREVADLVVQTEAVPVGNVVRRILTQLKEQGIVS
ncbi:shikimate kinase AroK [Sulfurivirga sp.]|uniref:shikimate kinase AroK n=1 Tax=Sulfurivirga sp. TaxID=2614236 RepID=UPI0025FA7480|nr:shikimate kinase AroK [Sulfurivirga sp.]